MPTWIQLTRKKRKKWKHKNKRIALQNCPQKKGMCVRVYEMTPKKPNSALRKVARVLLSNRRRVPAYLPGIGQNSLQKHSNVLVRGGRVKDLPGMKYTMIRGKFDLVCLQGRENARSKYGGKCYKRGKY